MGAHSLRNQYSVLQSHVLHYNEYISLIPRIKLLLSEIMQVLELIKDNNTSLDIDENTITRLNTAKIELGRDIDSVEGKKILNKLLN